MDDTLIGLRKSFERVNQLINHHQMIINWAKTKFMILTNKKIAFPKVINLLNNDVEVVEDFKLLRIMINIKLNFGKYFENLKLKVKSKLFAIKKLCFLSEKVRIYNCVSHL